MSLAFFRRLVVWVAIELLVAAGVIGGIAAGVAYVHDHTGSYVPVAGVLIGVGTALGSWFVAALLALFLEAVNSLAELVDLNTRSEGGES